MNGCVFIEESTSFSDFSEITNVEGSDAITIDHLCSLKTDQLLKERYDKFRRFGEWNEA